MQIVVTKQSSTSSVSSDLLQQIDTFVVDHKIITDGYLLLSKSIISSEIHYVNMNGLILFEGSNEDFIIDPIDNKIIFTLDQISMLTVGDKIQILYKYK